VKAQKHLALIVAAVLLYTGSSYAQGVASSFEQLRVFVKTGDTVSVRDAAGTETTGTIKSLSSSLLVFITSGTQRELTEADVATIRQRRADSLKNGALWGLGVGLAVGAVAFAAMCADGPCDADLALTLPICAGLGTSVGVGADALIISRHVVYERRVGSASVAVVPVLGGKQRGVALSMRF
jgi:hypothetical protein